MNKRLNLYSGVAVFVLITAGLVWWLEEEEAPSSQLISATSAKFSRNDLPSATSNAPDVSGQMLTKRTRKPLPPKEINPSVQLTKDKLATNTARLLESRKQAKLVVDREIEVLKSAVPALRSNQEQRIREALEKNMPQISMNESGGLVVSMKAAQPALDDPVMGKLYAEALDPEQRQLLEALIERRKRSREEVAATRLYARALDMLPDLNETQKNALHEYYRNHSATSLPREQQRQMLSSFLSPEEIERLRD